MSIADELEKLNVLKANGTITEQEYQDAKKAILANLSRPASPGAKLDGVLNSVNVNQWSMFIHLSQFCGFIVPGAGLVIPILLWQMKKNESPIIDQQGKNVTNWILSVLLYGLICFPLCFVLIGFLLLAILGVVAIIFPIIGGIKANDGEIWQYPMSINFIK